MAVLLACARTSLRDPDVRVIRDLAPRVDGPHLLALARVHGLTALTAHAVGDDRVASAVSADLRRELNRRAQQLGVVVAEQFAELTRVLALLDDAGITAVPHKGPVLAATLYGEIGMRPSADVDVLVHPSDVPAARRILQGDGYELLHHTPPLPPRPLDVNEAEEARLLTTTHEHVLRRADGRSWMDLHWAVAPRWFSVDLDLASLKMRTVEVEGRSFLQPTPEDLVLVLCVHGALDAWRKQLKWVVDLAELHRRHPSLDWEGLLERASSLRVLRMVLTGMAIAHRLLDTPLDPRVVEAVDRDKVVPELVQQATASLLATRPLVAAPSWGIVFHYRVRERKRDGVAVLVRRTLSPTPNDWTAVRLPDRMRSLYVVVHLARGVGVGFRWLWRRVARVTAVFERAPRVLFEVVDGQAVLLDGDGKRLVTLNRTGSLVWDALERPLEFSAVVDRVADRVDADRKVLVEDIGHFLGQLEEAGLVVHHHARR